MRPSHYFPILKARQGELDALGQLDPLHLGFVTAVLDIPPPGYRRTKAFGDDRERRSLDDHITGLLGRLSSELQAGPRLYLDGHSVRKEGSMQDGTPPVAHMVRSLADAGMRTGVVVRRHGMDRDLLALDDLIRHRHCEVCLRLVDADFEPSTVQPAAKATVEALGLKEHDVELVLDFGVVTPDRLRMTSLTAEAITRAVAQGRWKSIVAASTSYDRWPEEAKPGARPYELRRLEREVFAAAARGAPDRRVQYGDFGVNGRKMLAASEFAVKAGVKLRYTASEKYLLYFAGSLKAKGGEGFRAIAKDLVKRPEFTRGLSWGDRFIAECAENGGDTGGTSTWAALGTSHHVAFVLRELDLL